MIAVAWFLAGIVALIVGANFIVRGGSHLAAQMGIPPLVIGLTVVAIGTSAPELSIGIEAALRGNGSLTVGNIAGANTINILLSLGLSALLRPLMLQMQTLRFDLPVLTIAALLLVAMAWNGALGRIEGAILVAAAIGYTAAVVWTTKRETRAVQAQFGEEFGKRTDIRPARDIAWSLAALIFGIVAVVVGSDWLVDGAVALARILGVSDAFIGVTIVAIGTSSPELVTSIVGVLRNDREIAVGNLLGSSIYNILLVLGVICLVPSGGLELGRELIRIDIPVMAGAALLCAPIFFTGRRVSRAEGGALVAAYVVYLTYLLVART